MAKEVSHVIFRDGVQTIGSVVNSLATGKDGVSSIEIVTDGIEFTAKDSKQDDHTFFVPFSNIKRCAIVTKAMAKKTKD
jgi:hypothetical protein